MVLRVVTVKMPAEMVEKLDGYAASHGLDRSSLIRRAVESYLEREARTIVTRRLRVYSLGVRGWRR